MNIENIQELNNLINQSIKDKGEFYLIKKRYQIIIGCLFIALSLISIGLLIFATDNIYIQQALIAIIGILVIAAINAFKGIGNLKEDKEIQSLYQPIELDRIVIDSRTIIEGNYYTTTNNDYTTNNQVSNYTSNQKQNLTEAAAEIQRLLEQLSKTHPTKTPQEKIIIAAELVDEIDNSPTLKQRLISGLKAGGVSALGSMLSHPAASIAIAALEGWQSENIETESETSILSN